MVRCFRFAANLHEDWCLGLGGLKLLSLCCVLQKFDVWGHVDRQKCTIAHDQGGDIQSNRDSSCGSGNYKCCPGKQLAVRFNDEPAHLPQCA